jgi:hypothetical protein
VTRVRRLFVPQRSWRSWVPREDGSMLKINLNARGVWIGIGMLVAVLTFVGSRPAYVYAADTDCDSVADEIDNCPAAFNPDQDDIDGDLVGDRCDSDKDGDDLRNKADNCPRDANATQDDGDGDGVGDACDVCPTDSGGDVVNNRGCSIAQLCPCDGPDVDQAWRNHRDFFICVKKKARKFRRQDLVTRDQGRAIIVAARASTCGVLEPQAGDNDGDGVPDEIDNCPSDSNPSQRNTDGDAFGNACDTDKDGDTVLNVDDNCPLVANTSGQADDADGDGVGDACDACSETGLNDPVDRSGCSIDQACPCAADEDEQPWKSHGKYTRCVYDEAFRFRVLRVLSREEADAIKASAAASTCGARPPVCE